MGRHMAPLFRSLLCLMTIMLLGLLSPMVVAEDAGNQPLNLSWLESVLDARERQHAPRILSILKGEYWITTLADLRHMAGRPMDAWTTSFQQIPPQSLTEIRAEVNRHFGNIESTSAPREQIIPKTSYFRFLAKQMKP